MQTAAPALVPLPEKIEVQAGVFPIDARLVLETNEPGQGTAQYLAGALHASTGFACPIQTQAKQAEVANAVQLTIDANAQDLGAEGYRLMVRPDHIDLRAFAPSGLFYGVQTLLELMPPTVFASSSTNAMSWSVPCVTIEDRPRFRWRGLMLDVSRHFFTKHEVERVLDLMALHKLNVFHWHLVDDGGWRIEIKKYPRLTEAGAWRAGVGFGLAENATMAYGPDHRYGGFYTQQDIRDVVAYAAARHVEVVPEIEMPGHSLDLLTAYPQYGCTGGPYALQMAAGVQHGILCVGRDDTLRFIEDVLSEVLELFPSHYIHVGGDEVPIDNWKACPRCQARMKQEGLTAERDLESWFIGRVADFARAHGKTVIGWSEVRADHLPPGAVMMDWIGGGPEAAKQGHDVVMAAQKAFYFDHPESLDSSGKPTRIRHVTSLSSVYAFDPIPSDVRPEAAAHILGVEGCVWTEYIANLSYAEYMMLPRLCALSEVAWSPASRLNWDDFSARLNTQLQRLDAMGVNYRRVSSR